MRVPCDLPWYEHPLSYDFSCGGFLFLIFVFYRFLFLDRIQINSLNFTLFAQLIYSTYPHPDSLAMSLCCHAKHVISLTFLVQLESFLFDACETVFFIQPSQPSQEEHPIGTQARGSGGGLIISRL